MSAFGRQLLHGVILLELVFLAFGIAVARFAEDLDPLLGCLISLPFVVVFVWIVDAQERRFDRDARPDRRLP